MAKENPLKWRGVEALSALDLFRFKLPVKLGRSPVFFSAYSEITPFFIFTPRLKWQAVNTSGYLGLSFSGIDDFVNSAGKIDTCPPVMIHTANFPGELARYISPDEAEGGAFVEWAASINTCLRLYPTSSAEMDAQVRGGRLGGFGAAQQFKASRPGEPLKLWLADRAITIPTSGDLPIPAVSVPSAAVQ
jgi:hypothetical protein